MLPGAGINAAAHSVPGETSVPGERARDTSDRPAHPVLQELNRLFHDVYSARSDGVWQQLRSGATPVVVRSGDHLILHADGEVTEYEITGERYHELKAAGHVPAVAHLVLAKTVSPSDQTAMLTAALDELRDFGAGISAVVTSTQALLDRILEPGREPNLDEALADYRSATRCALETLAREAVVIEIDALDGAMRDIGARLTGERLQGSYFVICGGHQPRYKELSKMYFHRWLEAAGWPASRIEHQVLYAEGKESLDEALQLVQTRIVDGRLSAALFGDLTSLDEDVLGNAGIEQLDRRFGS